MSPSRIARKAWAALTGVGTVSIVTALAIGMTGWPPAPAYAEYAPGGSETVSLALTAPSSTGTATTAGVSAASVSDAKVKSLSKPPTAKIKVRKPRPKKRAHAKRRYAGKWQSARVSWYGPGFYGNTMAGGGRLTRSSMVVAHRSLRFGTRIQFRYGGRTVIAVVRDRGPYVSGRTFDLGPGTAQRLGFGGVGRVQYRIIGSR